MSAVVGARCCVFWKMSKIKNGNTLIVVTLSYWCL